MLCSSHLAIISILLAAASTTPFSPRDDGALAQPAEELTEPVEHKLAAPAAPRQVYTGHHGSAKEQALVTNAPVPIPIPAVGMVDVAGVEVRGVRHHHRRQNVGAGVSVSLSSTLLCPIPPQIVKATVVSTLTMVMNVATLWPRPLITARQVFTAAGVDGDAGADDHLEYDDQAPPIPTVDLLFSHLEARGADGDMPAPEGVAWDDDRQADSRLPFNPGGVIIHATPPPVPALETTTPTPTPTAPPLEPAFPSNSSSSSASQTTSPPTSSAAVVAEVPTPVAPAPIVQQGCTTTMLGNLARPCRPAGAVTVYESTVTFYSPVDCGACTSLHVIQPRWGCPFMSVESEVTADWPYTWTTYLCSGATTPYEATAIPTLVL